MKKLYLGFIVLTIIFGIYGCSSNAENNLEKKLSKYKQCFTHKDYICMSSLTLPSLIQEMGGTQNYVRIMQTLPNMLASQGMKMDPSKIKFGKKSDIIKQNDFYISIIPTEQPVKIQGRNGLIKSSFIAFSNDKGKSWFFLEGNDESKMMIADESPELLQKINIPSPTLKIGNRLLIQKNGQWRKQK